MTNTYQHVAMDRKLWNLWAESHGGLRYINVLSLDHGGIQRLPVPAVWLLVGKPMLILEGRTAWSVA